MSQDKLTMIYRSVRRLIQNERQSVGIWWASVEQSSLRSTLDALWLSRPIWHGHVLVNGPAIRLPCLSEYLS